MLELGDQLESNEPMDDNALAELRSANAALLDRVALLEKAQLGVSLRDVKESLGHLEGRLESIESTRGAWIRTLVLTLAAPLAAGVFGYVTNGREIELKRFEQNLALVDRSLDFAEGEAYRRAVLEYISDSNPDTELHDWAEEQLSGIAPKKWTPSSYRDRGLLLVLMSCLEGGWADVAERRVSPT